MEVFYSVASAPALAIATLYLMLVLLSPKSSRQSTPGELTYKCAKSRKALPLPSIDSSATVALSVIVPAFNETLRLKLMLKAAVGHLASVPSRSYEIIVVNDCSTDATTQTALDFAAQHPEVDLRVTTLAKNRGKGGAVQHGVLHCRGDRVLMVDADGASRFEDLESLWTKLDEIEDGQKGIAIGSRAHMVKTEAVVKRSFVRNLCMHGFHILLRTVGVGYIRDTQCGFKLFTRDSATVLFESLHIHGWIFDVELLILAQMLAIPVVEVPIVWHEIEGSKMSLLKDSINMAKDVLILRANYTIGRWKPSTTGRRKSE